MQEQLREIRERTQRQEDRSNIERGALATSIETLKDKQNEFAAEVRYKMDTLVTAKEFATTRDAVINMEKNLASVVERVTKIETPFMKILSRGSALLFVCTSIGGIFLYLFGDPLKAMILRFLTGGSGH